MLLGIARDAFFIIFIVKFIFKSMQGTKTQRDESSNKSDEYIFMKGEAEKRIVVHT
jgi:hypothetical protein